MESNNAIQLINFITGKSAGTDVQLNFEQVKTLIDMIESKTGCKVYNKVKLLEELTEKVDQDATKIKDYTKEVITKNLVPEVSFNNLFKSNLDFTLVFNNDDVNILYKNKKVELKDLVSIKEDLLENKLKHLPEITELFVDNVIKVIGKFMNKDPSVKYHCVNIPEPYWKLFEIKCKKANKQFDNNQEEYKHLDKVITGKIYEKEIPPAVQIQQQDTEDPELKHILMQIAEFEKKEQEKTVSNQKITPQQKKDLDDQHKMEIMSYLNDEEVMIFLSKLEQSDQLEKEPKYND
jgi:hypothetical protein